MKKYNYIIFDGKCGFCNKMIMFIAKNDKNNKFKFVSSHSVLGIKLLSRHQIRGLEKSTIILVENESKFHIKSLAIRNILLKLPYYKLIGNFMYIFPIRFSNAVYDIISKNRKLIIKNNICKIPTSKTRGKFIL